jgi:hypothetical protein
VELGNAQTELVDARASAGRFNVGCA